MYKSLNENDFKFKGRYYLYFSINVQRSNYKKDEYCQLKLILTIGLFNKNKLCKISCGK